MHSVFSFWQSIKDDIANILSKDPAAHSFWQVLFCYSGLHAIIWHRLAHTMHQQGYSTLARIIAAISRFLTGIEIHPEAHIGQRVFIDHGMGVVIGQTAHVGDDCTLYQGVTLGGTSLQTGKRHPTLGRHVVVSSGAKILGNMTIGDYAKVGANAVVLHPVPAYTTVVGIPAKPVEDKTHAHTLTSTIFTPYCPNPTDPLDVVYQAMHQLQQKVHAQALQIEALLQIVKTKNHQD